MRDDRRCRNAPFLEDRAVGHTGRAARPSITYGGNDDVALLGHLIRDSVLDWVGEPAPFRAHHDRLDRVTLFEQLTDGGKQVRRVELGVVKKAKPCAVQRAESPRGQLTPLLLRGTRGIQNRHLAPLLTVSIAQLSAAAGCIGSV